MAINYPNGQKNFSTPSNSQTLRKMTKPVLFGKRGMTLEQEINDTNLYYLSHQKAVVYKKPTPIKIVKVDYPKRSAAVIKEAYFAEASTTDYNGVYQGRYLDFEAKETKNKTSFPLSNFHPHQIEHMRACLKQQGICFIIISFRALNRLFVLKATDLFECWDHQEKRKSIPLSFIEKKAVEIQYSYNPTIPYLSAVDQFIEGEN